MRELLRLENVHYKYEGKYPALKGVSACVAPGERIAVLGGNGAGKSTFFLCCNGVLRPQSGQVLLNGREITASRGDVLLLRQAAGLVFQDPDSQIIAGTVESEVSFGPMNLRLPESEVRGRVSDSLSRMNLAGFENRAPQYLSGGEKKRVTIADILAMRPEIILLDEPTASLDPTNVAALEAVLADLHEAGMALLVSTHDVDFAHRFAERAIVFSGGAIIADGPSADVFASREILARAGLRKPLLCEAAELIAARKNAAVGPKMPRTVEEFSEFLAEIL